MKKIISIFLALGIVFTFISCNDEEQAIIQNNSNVSNFENNEGFDNLSEIIKGIDILRYPENYNSKEMIFSGYVLEVNENNITLTLNKLSTEDVAKLNGENTNSRRLLLYRCEQNSIKIPYSNNNSPRILIGDYITFKGTVHAELVEGEIQKSIENIKDMKIIEKEE